MHWHILTGEYPPVTGGVADYTQLVAHGLAAGGAAVTVWTPASPLRPVSGDDGRVRVEVLPDHFGRRALTRLSRELSPRLSQRLSPGLSPLGSSLLPSRLSPGAGAESGAHRLLVQYVPHAFGWKGGNLPFGLWLYRQRRRSVWVMFHEVAFPVDRHQRPLLNALGVVTRGLAALAGAAAERVFVSIPAWESGLRQLGVTGDIEWLPVPSVVAAAVGDHRAAELRRKYAGARPLIGHFGTYGRLVLPLLSAALASLGATTGADVLLMGRGSETVLPALLVAHPELRGRVHATGPLAPAALSQHIVACDCLLQPYPDGVSTRRTSAMAALAHGRPLVTTKGALTETLWEQTAAVQLCPIGDAAAMARACAVLLTDAAALARRSQAARTLYDARFDLRHTLARLAGERSRVNAA